MHVILYRQLHVLPEGMVVPSACLPACLPPHPSVIVTELNMYNSCNQTSTFIHSLFANQSMDWCWC